MERSGGRGKGEMHSNVGPFRALTLGMNLDHGLMTLGSERRTMVA